MMSIVNLTPHSIQMYAEEQFVNLEQVSSTTWIADGVKGEPVREYPSRGEMRISVSTECAGKLDGVPLVKTKYGDLVGIPHNLNEGDMLLVSLPTKSMASAAGHPLAPRMVCPYKVVRSRENGSTVLGSMGFTE